jgi:hypothetical protein
VEKTEILSRLQTAKENFAHTCSKIDAGVFFEQPAEKWSIAQHVQHLVISARSTRLAYRLPRFVLSWISGKPNRHSRSYDELVARYQTKLKNGGKAGGRFIPEPISSNYGHSKLIEQFKTTMQQLYTSIDRNWKDDQLDHYLAPHPLLGRITLRELGYFTIYHTWHHLAIIKQLTAQAA